MGRGKKTNKMYISMKEWTEDFGGKKEGEQKNPFRPLPFYCCSLSFQPFDDPVCTDEGTIFDIVNIIPWLKKYKKDPISGKPLSSKELIKLHFHKNSKGEYHCPVTFKVFTDFTHIVAIKPSGHVYCMEAIEELNIRAKNWNDLLTAVPFTRADILSIQDPQQLEKRNWSNFLHIKEGLKLNEEEEEDPAKNINADEATAKIFKAISDKAKEKERKEQLAPSVTPKPASVPRISQEVQAPSFTASYFSATELKAPHPADAPPKQTKKRGYVRFKTNMGELNLELHCDLVPRTCENFLELCERGYYTNTTFHRSIKDFMIQGGDPTGTGKGGESIWNRHFKDEFKQQLMHEARGVLSMANHGANTNGSQFFITYQAAPWLNFKHTVFGRVVGGLETLKLMEAVPADDKDRPLVAIKITGVDVFVNPFKHLEEEVKEALKKEEEKKQKVERRFAETDMGQWFSNPVPAQPKTTKTGIGKYIQSSNPAADSKKRTVSEELSSQPTKKIHS